MGWPYDNMVWVPYDDMAFSMGSPNHHHYEGMYEGMDGKEMEQMYDDKGNDIRMIRRREAGEKGNRRKGKGGRGRFNNSSKVFVGGLSAKTTEDTLRRIFSQFGTVIDASVLVDAVSERSRGFGYVTFQGDQVPEGVAGRDHIIDGRTCGARCYKYGEGQQ